MSDERSRSALIVTGFSGAGMSTALKHLEDLGYEVFDNFPLNMAETLLADPGKKGQAIAIGIDTRTRGFQADAVLDFIARTGSTLVFLTADEAELQKRFTETRRRHPLAKDRPATTGIKMEQDILKPLYAATDQVIDTTGLSTHELKRVLEQQFGLAQRPRLTITLMSFGFRFGLPREADIVMDIRFLKNPYWEPKLRALSGLDRAVADYISMDEAYTPFLGHFRSLLQTLLPRYTLEGKSYLTVALGCTGGRHRSVHMAETLKPWLEGLGFNAAVIHRDIER